MKNIKKLWPVLLAAVLTVMVWALGLGTGDVVFSDMHWNGLNFRGSDKTYSIADGDKYGLLNSGPGFTLPAGRYRVLATVDCDADNAVKIVTSNNARVEPAELIVPVPKSSTRMPSAVFPFLGIIIILTGSRPAPAPAAPLPSLPKRFSPTPNPNPILITGIMILSSVSIGEPIMLSMFMSFSNSSTVLLILFVIIFTSYC